MEPAGWNRESLPLPQQSSSLLYQCLLFPRVLAGAALFGAGFDFGVAFNFAVDLLLTRATPDERAGGAFLALRLADVFAPADFGATPRLVLGFGFEAGAADLPP